MAETAEPLLKKIYFENCPGCKVDQEKEPNTGVPYREFLYVCTTLPISSLFPFLYFMIRDLDVAKTEEDISFYAGFVGEQLFFSQYALSIDMYLGWTAENLL